MTENLIGAPKHPNKRNTLLFKEDPDSDVDTHHHHLRPTEGYGATSRFTPEEFPKVQKAFDVLHQELLGEDGTRLADYVVDSCKNKTYNSNLIKSYQLALENGIIEVLGTVLTKYPELYPVFHLVFIQNKVGGLGLNTAVRKSIPYLSNAIDHNLTWDNYLDFGAMEIRGFIQVRPDPEERQGAPSDHVFDVDQETLCLGIYIANSIMLQARVAVLRLLEHYAAAGRAYGESDFTNLAAEEKLQRIRKQRVKHFKPKFPDRIVGLFSEV